MSQSRERIEWWVPLVVVGVVLVVAPFAVGVSRGALISLLTNPIRLVLYVGPGLGVIYGAMRLRSAGFDRELSLLVLKHTLTGITVLLVIVVLLGLSQQAETGGSDINAWSYTFGAGIGAVAGVLIGYNQSRAVTNARRAAREELRKTVAKEERETLQFLNETLRHHVLNGMQLIRGNATMLADDVPQNSIQAARAANIIERSDAVTGLIRNVRTLGRTVERPPEQSAVDLTQVLEGEVEAARQQFRDAQFDASIAPGVTVQAGPLLSVGIENLLRNAAMHAGDDPTIHVTLTLTDNHVQLVVEDDGPGIPPDVRDTLFERSEAATDGLGLYLVDRIVTRYGGSISVDTSSLGGAAIVLTLDRSIQAGTSNAGATADDD